MMYVIAGILIFIALELWILGDILEKIKEK